MSFVLEALRRQEAAENPDAAAALYLADTRRHRQRLWIGLFLAALLVNVGLVTWLVAPGWLDALRTPGSPGVVDIVTGADPAADTPAATAAAPDTAPASPADAAPEPVSEPPLQRTTLERLPASVRVRVPGLLFSTHVYSEEADLRAVVANGRRLVEGDRFGALTLVEVTATGVVMRFETYLIEIPIVGLWEAS